MGFIVFQSLLSGTLRSSFHSILQDGSKSVTAQTRGPSAISSSLTSPPLPRTGPYRSEQPSLPQLMHFQTITGEFINIIDAIGSNYRAFGIFILDDKRGVTVGSMHISELGNPNAVVLKIFSKWLQGVGKTPRSWGTLVTVLEEMKVMDELASTVRNNLREN